MKSLKKFLILTFVIACILGLTGCKKDKDGDKDNDGDAPVTLPEGCDTVVADSFDNIVNGKDVYLTCVGQADIGTVQAILKKVKKADGIALEAEKDYIMDAQQDPGKVAEGSVVILVVGASGKGLGAAGTDIKKETARAEAFAELANQDKITLIAVHVGGASRRGESTDGLIKKVCPKADLTMVVYTGNTDKIFEENTTGNLYQYSSSAKMVDSFKKIFGLLS